MNYFILSLFILSCKVRIIYIVYITIYIIPLIVLDLYYLYCALYYFVDISSLIILIILLSFAFR